MFDDEAELEMFDMVAADLINGVDIAAQLWKKRSGANVDPVHDDFKRELYKGPYDIHANAVQGFDKILTMDADAGFQGVRESELWVSRRECERVGYGFIETGDVIAFLLERKPGPYYFYIQNAHQTGRTPQGRAFVMWKVEVRSFSRYSAEDAVGSEEGDACATKQGRRID